MSSWVLSSLLVGVSKNCSWEGRELIIGYCAGKDPICKSQIALGI